MTNNFKILIVEDEKPIARALELKLSREGFQTKIVLDGAEALNSLSEENFDVVLLDLVMPKMDGFKVLEEMNKRNIKTKTIVLSNLSQKEDLIKAKEELGAYDYFVKSDISISDIVKYLKDILKIS
jgi:DNA-binding response OmpR family regulator